MGGLDERRARGFGEVAELYDRARPAYPDRLIDDVVAAVPGARDVVEIGCGTGKASAKFAARGLRVVGIEPSTAMAAIARRSLSRFGGFRVDTVAFEEWEGERGSADIVAAAQAWHWVDHDVALPKISSILRRPGVLAVFANTPRPEGTGVRDALDEAYRANAPELADTSVMTRWSRGPLRVNLR